MTVTVASFRQNFPEFGSITKYPNSQAAFWLDVADKLVANRYRWGELRDTGIQLFVAHMLVLEYQAQQQSQTGGLPGTDVGPVNNKSVDKVSYGMDVAAATDPGAGHWNLTTYGTRYMYLVKLIGMGPIQVGIGCGGLGQLGWQGPWEYNYPNPSQ